MALEKVGLLTIGAVARTCRDFYHLVMSRVRHSRTRSRAELCRIGKLARRSWARNGVKRIVRSGELRRADPAASWLATFVAVRLSRCWHCDEPVGKGGKPNPFVIEDDAPFWASVCEVCYYDKPDLKITSTPYHRYTLDGHELAKLGRRSRTDGITYWRASDIAALSLAAEARHQAEQAAKQVKAAERRRLEEVEAARREEESAARQKELDAVLAELDEEDVEVYKAARTRYQSISSTAGMSTALSALDWGPAPTIDQIQKIVELFRQYAEMETRIRSRLVEPEFAYLLPLVVTLLLRSREAQESAWIDELLSKTQSLDQFLAALKSTFKPSKPKGCKPGCGNWPKAKACPFVRCAPSPCADPSRSDAVRAATALAARVTDEDSCGRRACFVLTSFSAPFPVCPVEPSRVRPLLPLRCRLSCVSTLLALGYPDSTVANATAFFACRI